MHNTTLFIIFIIIIIIIILFKSTDIIEHVEGTINNLSNEAINNICSIYNNNYMIVTNLNVTDEITAKNIKASTATISTNLNVTEEITAKNIKATNANITANLNVTEEITAKNINATTSNISTNLNTKHADINTLQTNNATIDNDATIKNLLTTNKLSVNTIGTDDNVYWGNHISNEWCDGAQGSSPSNINSVGLTHDYLFNKPERCNNMCPPGMYMVGIRQGKQYADKHPLCKKFK